MCLAQKYPYVMSLVSSKDSVLSTEVFTVTFSLSEVKGYVYIGVVPGSCETIGPERWEGEIKAGEIKTISFRLKLRKNASDDYYIRKSIPVSVAWGREPLGKNVLRRLGIESVLIKLKDYAELRKNVEKAK